MLNDFRTFLALCVIALVAAVILVDPHLAGDWHEYTSTAVAIARHGTPDLRVADLQAASRLFGGWGEYEKIAASIATASGAPQGWFFRAGNGQVFASHFFAYPALVGAAIALLTAAGAPAIKAVVLVHAVFVFILALALHRLSGSGRRAALGVGLFMLCGGASYWTWTSPELVTSAAFLAAIAFFVTGAPVVAGLLAGLASMQNPPIALFVAFAPLLLFALRADARGPWLPQARALFGRRHVAGLAVVIACAAIPVAFNEWAWGVPNLIAKLGTSPRFVSAGRLFSYFFDINQGMVIGFPAVAAALAVVAARSARAAVVLAVALAFTIGLALPALTTGNWNSGAQGMMRYAFWGGMPLLYVLLHSLSTMEKVPVKGMALVLVVQALATWSSLRYDSVHLSPPARFVLKTIPWAYNPIPEIFSERVAHREEPGTARAYAYPEARPMKVLAHADHGPIDADVCGPGRRASGYTVSDAGQGWRYFNGPFRCE